MISNIEQKLSEAYNYAINNNAIEVLINGITDNGERCFIKAKLNKKEKKMDVTKFWLLGGKVIWENGKYYGDRK